MAYRINLTSDSQRITAATIDSSCTPRDRSLNKYTGVTTNNAWADIVNGDSTPGDTALVLVINANTSSSSRQGYGEIMYNINGTECSTILHLVQAGNSSPVTQSKKLYIKLGAVPSWATSGNYDIFLVKDDFTDSQVNTMKEEDPTVDGTTDSEGRTYLCQYQVSNNAGTCTYVEDSLASAGLWMFYNNGGTVDTTDFTENTRCWVYIREKTGQKRIERLDNRVEFSTSSVNCNDYVMMT